jgi:uncharacterized protein (TIGR02996 family)
MSGDALLQAIHADPDDLAPRLAYADWLEENGGEAERARAAFIRLQAELERLRKGKKRSSLEKRANEMIAANADWTNPVTKKGLADRPVFRRGFLHGVSISATRFTKVGAKLFKAAPTLRAVIFPDASNELNWLSKSPLLERLAEIDVSKMCRCGTCPIERDLQALFASPHLGGLVKLRIAGNRMDANGARALAASTAFPSLRELDASSNRIGDEGASGLVEAAWLAQLARLDLRRNRIGAAAADALRQRFGDAVVV